MELHLFPLRALPAVAFFVEGKTFGASLVSAVLWNVTYNALLFEEGIILATAVTGIGQQVGKQETFVVQPPFYPQVNILQVLAIDFVGMISLCIGNYMVGRIDTNVPVEVQLPCLPRFYTDAGIGIGGAVMGFVTGILGKRVARSLTGILVFCPLLVTGFYAVEFLAGSGYLLLLFGCLVVFGLTVGKVLFIFLEMLRTFNRCSARVSAGTFNSRLSMLALAFMGAESVACVCQATIPFSAQRENTWLKSSSKTSVGNSCRVRLMVLCHGSSSSMSYPRKKRMSMRMLQCSISCRSLMMFSR